MAVLHICAKACVRVLHRRAWTLCSFPTSTNIVPSLRFWNYGFLREWKLTSVEPERDGQRCSPLVVSFHKPVKEGPPLAIIHGHVASILLESHERLSRQPPHKLWWVCCPHYCCTWHAKDQESSVKQCHLEFCRPFLLQEKRLSGSKLWLFSNLRFSWASAGYLIRQQSIISCVVLQLLVEVGRPWKNTRNCGNLAVTPVTAPRQRSKNISADPSPLQDQAGPGRVYWSWSLQRLGWIHLQGGSMQQLIKKTQNHNNSTMSWPPTAVVS